MTDGLELAPFRALRYTGELAAKLSPPYDVVGDAQRTALAAADPHNAVRLILPEGPADGPDNRYQQAAAELRRWRASGAVALDPDPALYVYEISGPGVQTRGLLGAVALRQAEDGVILPHEDTMPGPVADRLALLEAVDGDLEPIFLIYPGSPAVEQVLTGVDQQAPLADATTEDGLRHRLWAVADPETLLAIAAELRPQRALIADGHHRYATYLAHQQRRRGPGPWDHGLAYLVDAGRFAPGVEATHRVVRGLVVDEAARRAAGGWSVADVDGPVDIALARLAAADRPAFLITDGQRWLLVAEPTAEALAAVPADRGEAWRSLDVTIAHRALIEGAWGVADTEDNVGYTHDPHEAIERARAVGGVALLLKPTPIEQVSAVAAHGDRMPRKSTLFVPKPRTGMLFRMHADNT